MVWLVQGLSRFNYSFSYEKILDDEKSIRQKSLLKFSGVCISDLKDMFFSYETEEVSQLLTKLEETELSLEDVTDTGKGIDNSVISLDSLQEG